MVVVPDFWNQHFDTPLLEGKVDFRYLLPSISLEGGTVNNRFVLAYEEKEGQRKLVGVLNYMCSKNTEAPTIFLDKVCVHADHRRQGLANKMIDIFKAKSAQTFPEAIGWITFPLGKTALHLAQRMGFQDVSHMVVEPGMKGLWARMLSLAILVCGTWSALLSKNTRD